MAAVCDTPESVERAGRYARENGMLFYDPDRMLQMLMGDADVDVKLYFGLHVDVMYCVPPLIADQRAPVLYVQTLTGERNAGYLQQLCQARGCQFRMVDMRG